MLSVCSVVKKIMNENITQARFGLLLGLGVGIAIGTATDNIAVGVGVGVALAVAFSQGFWNEKEANEDEERIEE